MRCLALPPLFSSIRIADDLDQLPSAPVQQGETDLGDSPWTLFTMYSNILEEEDRVTMEKWDHYLCPSRYPFL